MARAKKAMRAKKPKGEDPAASPADPAVAHQGEAVEVTPPNEEEDYDEAFEGPFEGATARPEPTEDLSDLPAPLQEAIRGFGLLRDHVIGHRLLGEGGVSLVTRGGRKLTWPDDQGRTLTPADKGDAEAKAPRFWTEGFLEKGPAKKA